MSLSERMEGIPKGTKLVEINIVALTVVNFGILAWYFLFAVNPLAYDPAEFDVLTFGSIIFPFIMLLIILKEVRNGKLLARIVVLLILLGQIYLSGLLIGLEIYRYQNNDEISSGIYSPFFLIPFWITVAVLSIINVRTVIYSFRQ